MRKRIRSSRLDEVREMYEHTCASCGEYTVDVGHLYEDAQKVVSPIDCLILLCPTCNSEEERARHKGYKASRLSLIPDEKSSLSRSFYRDGRYLCSYQTARFAAYLYEFKFHNASMAMACLTDAISSLRPIRHGPFIAAAICEAHRIAATAPVGLIRKWLFVDRLALVLFDYMRISDAVHLQKAASLLRDKIKSDERDPDQFERDSQNAHRRGTLIRGAGGDMSSTALTGYVIPTLLEEAETFRKAGEFDSFATNLDVASKLLLEVVDDSERSHACSELALDYERKITHKWVLQEHHQRESRFFLSKQDSRKARRHAEDALALYNRSPVMLEPRLTPDGPVENHPLNIINDLHINTEELREKGIYPSRNPGNQELPISSSYLEVFVRDFVQYGV